MFTFLSILTCVFVICGLFIVSFQAYSDLAEKQKLPSLSIDSDCSCAFELVRWHLGLRCFPASCALHFSLSPRHCLICIWTVTIGHRVFDWLLCIRWGLYPTRVKKIMVALSCVNISTENVFGLNFQFAVPTIYRGIKVRSMGIRIPSEMNERVGMVRLKKTLATITSDRVSFACHASTLDFIQSRIYWLPAPAPAPAPRPAPPPPIMLRAL